MFGNKPKSLDGILSSFTKTLEDLRDLREANIETAETKEIQASNLVKEAEDLRLEAERASKIEQNINQLLA